MTVLLDTEIRKQLMTLPNNSVSLLILVIPEGSSCPRDEIIALAERPLMEDGVLIIAETLADALLAL